MGLAIAIEDQSWSHVGFIFFSIVSSLVANSIILGQHGHIGLNSLGMFSLTENFFLYWKLFMVVAR